MIDISNHFSCWWRPFSVDSAQAAVSYGYLFFRQPVSTTGQCATTVIISTAAFPSIQEQHPARPPSLWALVLHSPILWSRSGERDICSDTYPYLCWRPRGSAQSSADQKTHVCGNTHPSTDSSCGSAGQAGFCSEQPSESASVLTTFVMDPLRTRSEWYLSGMMYKKWILGSVSNSNELIKRTQEGREVYTCI